MAQRSVVLALALWCLVAGGEAVWLELSTTAAKCFSEEIQSNIIVIGDYSILFDAYPTRPVLSVKVTSPYGNVLHHKDKVMQGQFSFNTAEAGNYLACFWVDNVAREMVVNLNLEWRIGIATKDWDALAKTEKLEGVALELAKLETAVEEIRENLMYLISKEADMRDVSDWTNSKITWLSLMSLSVCIMASIAQLWHLKRYFRKKKLI
ncbi:transmembrane emp24 domain-containing protein p24delta3-like [Oryza brachyantha]|uniref:transmembrane emp24 domain-containing protein p24delta3-like n=1 Tax=Oryza brachyantha TaxID=4533 RepID=UPI0007769B29|nr:transmembrane emp24 domain-containing protein p24delta3-like [Oryza brachyantha]